ncbi:MAG: helix-turn-helix domain-containing protein [Deltaproteobacteria bacterium]|nr:helix-turn-helix domain-containing protein [Deltaproteobacteria bacterium]
MNEIAGVGKKIRKLRKQAGFTQRDVALRSGLTVSYLSRLENDRITPSVKTLRRVADALEVPISLLFGDVVAGTPEHCPVSLSGQCILEHRFHRNGSVVPGASKQKESYNSEQLAILQECNDILQHGDAELLTALERLVHSLVLMQKARDVPPPLAGDGAGGSDPPATGPEPTPEVIPVTGARSGP